MAGLGRTWQARLDRDWHSEACRGTDGHGRLGEDSRCEQRRGVEQARNGLARQARLGPAARGADRHGTRGRTSSGPARIGTAGLARRALTALVRTSRGTVWQARPGEVWRGEVPAARSGKAGGTTLGDTGCGATWNEPTGRGRHGMNTLRMAVPGEASHDEVRLGRLGRTGNC